ncbi:hypothetical protein RhiJN_16450 [Ceratobasidium sp. AG-Ba]|nr:hypothetical protein RhiJN_16450 [Ceratobasidium sp. AG-Ba]
MTLPTPADTDSHINNALIKVAGDSDYDSDSTGYSDSARDSNTARYSDTTGDSSKGDHTPAREDVVSVLRARVHGLRTWRPTLLPGQWDQTSPSMREIRTRFPENCTPSYIERHTLRCFPVLTEGTRAKLRLRLAYESGRITRIPRSFVEVYNIMAWDMTKRDQRDLRAHFVLPAARIVYRLPSFLEDFLEPWLSSLGARTDSAPAPPYHYVG